jgi:hypothetical protein
MTDRILRDVALRASYAITGRYPRAMRVIPDTIRFEALAGTQAPPRASPAGDREPTPTDRLIAERFEFDDQ